MCLKDTLLRFVNVEWGMLNVELGGMSQGVLSDSFSGGCHFIPGTFVLSDKRTRLSGLAAKKPFRLYFNALLVIFSHSGFVLMPCQASSVLQTSESNEKFPIPHYN